MSKSAASSHAVVVFAAFDRAVSIGVCSAVLTILAFASSVSAQEVRGTVRLEDSGEPVIAAVVELLNDGGGAIVRTLTDDRGGFRLPVRIAGSYRLRVERIGLAEVTTEAFAVDSGAIVMQDVAVGMRPVSLEGLEIASESRCTLQRDAPAPLHRVWTEARKTLHAVALLEDVWSVRFRVRHWEHDVDPEARVRSSPREWMSIVTQAQPFASAPVDELLTRGFIREERDSTSYYAPDADVLLSDLFLDTHCFRVIAGDEDRIGLAFEPLDPAVGQDVRGVLWLDRASAALHELEYTYTNTPSAAFDLRTGGSVAFGQIDNGAWIIRRWQVRMPRYAIVNGMPTGRIVFVRERGGEVMDAELRSTGPSHFSARPPESVVTLQAPPPAVVDTVVEYGDDAGDIPATLPGDAQSLAPAAEAAAERERVRARDESLERAAAAIRARAAAAQAEAGTRTGRIVGTVVDEAQGGPVAGALVRIAGTNTAATTDARGRFGLEAPSSVLTLQVEHGAYETAEDTLTVRAGELVRVDVQLGPIALDPVIATARRTGLLADVYWRVANHIGGVFVTAAEVERRGPRFTMDVVRGQPGVHAIPGGVGRTGRLYFRSLCAPYVYLDGVPVTKEENRRSDFAMQEAYGAVNLIHPFSIEMIEIYRGASEVPGEFGGSTGGCGVVAIWTRRGG